MHTVREAALEEESSEDEQPDHHKIVRHLIELVMRAMREPRQVKTHFTPPKGYDLLALW